MLFRPSHVALCFFLLLPLNGCISIKKEDVDLPNGYTLSCDKGKNCCVLDRNSFCVIWPEVAYYSVTGDYVIGQTVHQNNRLDYKHADNDQRSGYFILNTFNGNYISGSSKSEWIKDLTIAGIKAFKLNPTEYNPTKNFR